LYTASVSSGWFGLLRTTNNPEGGSAAKAVIVEQARRVDTVAKRIVKQLILYKICPKMKSESSDPVPLRH
jgi:hypothetical protein